MSNVTLTAAMRSNLLSLQGTQRLLDTTSLRLATGKKVNGALDNPNSFFASQSLTNRSSDLSRLLDGIGQSIQVLKAADEGIKTLTTYLEQAQAIAQEALDQANASGTGATDITQLQNDYNAMRSQIDTLVADAGYRGTNLLNDGSMTVTFNEGGTASLAITGVDFSTGTGSDLTISAANFSSATFAQAALNEIKAGLTAVRAQARTFGNNLTVIQAREDFTKNLINVLKEGSDKLVLADQNEESANMLALQTAQQLGITSLSLASQAQQSILRLF